MDACHLTEAQIDVKRLFDTRSSQKHNLFCYCYDDNVTNYPLVCVWLCYFTTVKVYSLTKVKVAKSIDLVRFFIMLMIYISSNILAEKLVCILVNIDSHDWTVSLHIRNQRGVCISMYVSVWCVYQYVSMCISVGVYQCGCVLVCISMYQCGVCIPECINRATTLPLRGRPYIYFLLSTGHRSSVSAMCNDCLSNIAIMEDSH